MILEIDTFHQVPLPYYGQELHHGKTDLAISHSSIPGQVHSVMMRVPSEAIQC